MDNEKLNKLIEDYECENDNLDYLANDIREAVMNLLWNDGPKTYRFNQIGIIYNALEKMFESQAEMKFMFHQIVELADGDDTNTADEES